MRKTNKEFSANTAGLFRYKECTKKSVLIYCISHQNYWCNGLPSERCSCHYGGN